MADHYGGEAMGRHWNDTGRLCSHSRTDSALLFSSGIGGKSNDFDSVLELNVRITW
jgi:hypothetical protein